MLFCGMPWPAGLAHSSISTYLSDIRQVQISHGFGDPHLDQMSRLRQVLKESELKLERKGELPFLVYQ